ncbi:superoxide dismutase [Peziza echinospora]|nr:superoxide dismutase [Peziza echinospora]
MIAAFQSNFAVDMTCQSCVDSITSALENLPGVQRVQCNLETQIVTVEGTAAPSLIASAIQDTGRDAILRGSGGSNSAAVCILETHAPNISDPVRGLVRMVQVSPSVLVLDITVRGLAQGTYNATIRERGDISRGAASTGGVWEGSRGTLGRLEVDSAGVSGALVDKEIAIWELIGRSIVVSREISQRDGELDETAANDEYTLVGVIARSAGVWENDKTVCSCTGKTVWDERKESVQKGMI